MISVLRRISGGLCFSSCQDIISTLKGYWIKYFQTIQWIYESKIWWGGTGQLKAKVSLRRIQVLCLRFLFKSEVKTKHKIDMQIGVTSTAMRSLNCSVVKKEWCRKVNLSIHQLVYVPILTHGHELSVIAERLRLQIHLADMSFLCRVTHRVSWLQYLFQMPLEHLPERCIRFVPHGREVPRKA